MSLFTTLYLLFVYILSSTALTSEFLYYLHGLCPFVDLLRKTKV